MKTTIPLIIIIVALSIYATITTIKHNESNNNIDKLNNEIKGLRLDLESKTDSIIIKYKYINNKLIENEEKINNTIVTDSALLSFIANHERQ